MEQQIEKEKTPQEKVNEMYTWMKDIKGFMDTMRTEFEEEKKVQEDIKKPKKEKGLFETLSEDLASL
jgi:Sec-independent protein translocase protein TatA